MQAEKKVIELPTKQEAKVISTIWPFANDTVEEWAYWNNAFTPDECKEIIRVGELKGIKQGSVIGDKPIDPKIRECGVGWLYPDDINWAYKRISHIITVLNNDFFKFDLFGLAEGFQFTKYEAPSNHYSPHTDKYYKGLVRKLSISVQLSDPQDYEGGQLALHLGGEPLNTPNEQGKLIAFPSYTMHEVKPVTEGTRYSLVAWVTGAPFK